MRFPVSVIARFRSVARARFSTSPITALAASSSTSGGQCAAALGSAPVAYANGLRLRYRFCSCNHEYQYSR
jgi:hypothetical protein